MILVTHQMQYLTRCDNILVFRKGFLAAQGSYDMIKDKLNITEQVLYLSHLQFHQKEIKKQQQRGVVEHQNQQNQRVDIPSFYKREQIQASDDKQIYKRYLSYWSFN